MTRRRPRRATLLAAGGAAIACIALAVVVALGGDDRRAGRPPAQRAAPDLRDVARNFTPFRRPATARDRFTATRRPSADALALRFDDARLVHAAPTARAWAVPGKGLRAPRVEEVLCLYRQRAAGAGPGIAGGCAPVREARARGVVFVTNGDAPRTLLLVGLVPDGVERADLSVDGEQPRSVGVRHNYFEAEVSGPGRASFTGPAGTHEFPFGGFPGA